jgi:Lrp/AsnC family transcriptional regulator for asnA, asnC and gidA
MITYSDGLRKTRRVWDDRPHRHWGADVLDDMDKRIVRLLQRNARVPNTEIARALNVTEATVRNRVSRLLDEELIGIVAVVDQKATEATISTFIGISVDLAHAEEVAEAMRGRPEARYVAQTLGPSQVLAETFFRDHDHLLSFRNEFLGSLPGVTRVDVSIVLRVHKLSYEWEI